VVAAKFKYDHANPPAHRARAADRLERRPTGRDVGAAAQQRRRLARIGTWSPR
jgi:transcriptional regulator